MRRAAFMIGLILFGVVCAEALGPVGAGAQQPPPAVPRFDFGDSIDVRDVEMFDRIIYFPVSINGSGPFPFVLDTGAGSFSAIDDGTARSIGIRSTIVGQGGGAGEELVQFGLSDSNTVAIPGLSFVDRPFLTFPMRRMDAQWGKRKDGMVGGDLLSVLVTVIDYDRGRVVFHDASKYEYSGPGERIPVTMLGDYIIVPVDVLLYGADAPIRTRFLLDTGVRISVFSSPFAKEHGLAAQSPKTLSGITGFGIGGASKGVIGRVRGLQIGSFRFENPVMTFSADTSGALSDTTFAGIFCADFLSRFTVVLDYARSQIVLEKGPDFDAPFEFDMSGIRFAFEGERFDTVKVFLVYDGSPAARAGIAAGDLVTAIDGRPAGSFTRDDLRGYMQREGKQVRFTIKRGSETRDVTIRLQRLI
jgi:hypothetical protein